MKGKHLSTKAIIDCLENGSVNTGQKKHLQGCTVCSEKMAVYRKLLASLQHEMNPHKIDAIEAALDRAMDARLQEDPGDTAKRGGYRWRLLYTAGAAIIFIVTVLLVNTNTGKNNPVEIAGNGSTNTTNRMRLRPYKRKTHPSYTFIEVKGYEFQLTEEWKTTAGPARQSAFSRIFGGRDHDSARGVCRTADEGYAAVGHSFSLKGSDCDLMVVKFDSRGRTNWVKTLGGKYADKGMDIIETRDHGFLVCGYTESFNAAGRDGWVIKLDRNGTVQWARKYGCDENDILYSARQTKDNGYLLAGYTYTGRIARKAWVLRINSSGKKIWVRRYGGKIKKAAYAMDTAPDGTFVLTGTRQLPGNSQPDVWLQKISPSGKVIWEYTWGGKDYDAANAVRIAQDGSCYLAGYTQPKNSWYNDFLVQKISSAGKMIWSRTAGFAGMDQARCAAISHDGTVVVAGESCDPETKKRRMLIYSFTPQGKILWEKVYTRGIGDAALSIQAARDDGFIIAGYSISKKTLRKNIWLLKLDSNGLYR